MPGSHQMAGMQRGIVEASRTLALLSSAYLASSQNQEWLAAVAADPDGSVRKLVPIWLEGCFSGAPRVDHPD